MSWDTSGDGRGASVPHSAPFGAARGHPGASALRPSQGERRARILAKRSQAWRQPKLQGRGCGGRKVKDDARRDNVSVSAASGRRTDSPILGKRATLAIRRQGI